RLISESSIEKSIDEKDDDWIVFKFGEPDAAISPFRVPNSKLDFIHFEKQKHQQKTRCYVFVF
ncbi:MAG TPA: hypothetical protein VGP58_07275, partial [Pyrinomonadaceae bacterium]|nr:hypothetical protein [Pyrinomonadaceae bacterium]